MLCWEKSSTFCAQSIDIDPVRVVKVTKKRITLEFENEKNETKQMQFHNCYGGLVGAIKTKNTITPQS